MNYDLYKKCNLCARHCGADRTAGGLGYCKSADVMRISRAALHMWEEPIISGEGGSGTVFFSGCSLGCIYCQNRKISGGNAGREVSENELANLMLSLQTEGAVNINLVTPTHYVPSIISSVGKAREIGLKVPIVYNTGSYDTQDTIKMLEGIVDIYLPDLKYYKNRSADKLSFAEDYPNAARAAITEMVRQQPTPIIKDGIMQKGVIARILLLPEHLAEAKLNVKYLYEAYGDVIYISLMNQYTPMKGMKPPLNRRVTNAEYNELVRYAERLGVVNAFIQEDGTQSESFIPDFDDSLFDSKIISKKQIY